MKVIFILSDSLRRDHLGCYGAKGIHTPNIDSLAKESAVFDRAYAASYPTIPNRHDLILGRYTFPFRGWERLQLHDLTLPEMLAGHSIVSQLIFDPPPVHYGNFMRGFSSWWYIRGHHSDPYVTDPTIPTDLPAAPYKLRDVTKVRQHLRNRSSWQYEKDYMAPMTINKAMEWLERNYTHDKFFLWVDIWDPHVPLDPPKHYLKRYADLKDSVENIIYPVYGRSDYMTEAEARRVQALYAGEVTMVDTWVGQLVDTTERLGIKEETLIIFTSDHGHLFGEHNLEGKPGGILNKMYGATTRIPLIMWDPRGFGSGKRIDDIVQPPDILPTILEFFGIPVPNTVQGVSMLPLLKEETEPLHEYAFSSRFSGGGSRAYGGVNEKLKEASKHDGWAGPAATIPPVAIATESWALICYPQRSTSELYNLDSDPMQHRDLIADRPDVAEEMRQAFINFLKQLGAPAETVEPFVSESSPREHLNPDQNLHCIHDERGKVIAFGTREQAKASFAAQTRHQEIDTISFGELVERDPKALIKMHGQFYWAEDLAHQISQRHLL